MQRLWTGALLLWSLAATAPAKDLTIGVEAVDYLPYYTGKGDQYTGFARELFDLFAKETGHRLTFRVLPVNRLFDEFLAKNSKLDFKFPDHSNWQQKLKQGHSVVYSDPVVPYVDGVLTTSTRAGINELRVIGTARGFTPWDYLGDIKAGRIKKVENNSLTGLLMQAVDGRIDGAYFNIFVARHLYQTLGQGEKLVFLKKFPHTRSSYHLSSIRHPQVIKEFNQFMHKHKARIQSLHEKHGLTDKHLSH